MKRLSFFAALLVGWGIAGSGFAQTAAQYIAAGNQYYAGKDYVKGAQYYKAATQMDPNSAAAFQGLGNCLYVQGNNTDALAAYEKALSLNPNNAQLSSFVQTLRAKVGASAAPAATSAPAAASPAAASPSNTETKTAKTFEIAPMIGVGVGASAARGATLSAPATSMGWGTGFGGGFEAYYLVSGNFGVGLVFDFFTGYGQAPITAASGPYTDINGKTGTENVMINFNTSSVEIMPAIKYKFDGN